MATFEKRETKNGESVKVVVRVTGFPVKRKTFKRLTDAKIWAQQVEASMRKGEFVDVTRDARKHTLADLITFYEDTVLSEKTENTKAAELVPLKWWKAELGEYALTQVTSELIAEKIRFLRNEPSRRGKEDSETEKPLKSRRTIKAYRDTLDRVFKKAIKWKWVVRNPFDDIDPITKLRNERVRFLDDAERDNLLNACKKSYNEYLYLIVVFALSTGGRKSEIMNLTWNDVDLERGFAIFRNTKNGDTRSVPVTSHLLVLLKEMHTQGNGLVFPRSDGLAPLDIRKSWEKAVRDAGLENFKFHDLRHSAASYLAMNGATLSEIAAVLGHKTLQMVKRYSHISEQHAAGVVAKMNDKIFSGN